MRDKSKNPEPGDTVGEGQEKRIVIRVDDYELFYEDAHGNEHKTTRKSWRDMLRKKGLK